jgi:hypothetical protein
MATLTRRQTFAPTRIGNFAGGLNLRDALTELAPGESPDLLNVTLDERGGVRKRLGYTPWNAAPVANLITYGTESKRLSLLLWYSAADGKLYRDPGTGVLTLSHTFTVAGRVSIADFAGSTYLIHSADGLYTSADGVTWTAVVAGSGSIPAGDQLAVWQNKLWVADSTTNLLTFSAPGDATLWDPMDDAGSNYIREGNDFPIVALYGATGTDFQTNPSLLVGKRSGGTGSTHRVTDAATGDYVTLDQTAGPAGPHAITSLYGAVYVLSTAGVFATDGQSSLVPVGQKLEPLFTPQSLDYAQAAGFCAGQQRDRLYFSVARQGAAGNDLCVEYHPLLKAASVRTDAAAIYVSYTADNEMLLGASPTITGQTWKLNNGGSDNGTDITSRFLTRIFEPGGGSEARLQHIRVLGRGASFTLKALPNFQADGPDKTVTIVGTGFTWDTDGWDDPTVGWGEDVIEGYADFWPRLVGRAFQLRIDETSSLVSTAPELLGDGAALPVGAWALYGCELEFTPLTPS